MVPENILRRRGTLQSKRAFQAQKWGSSVSAVSSPAIFANRAKSVLAGVSGFEGDYKNKSKCSF